MFKNSIPVSLYVGTCAVVASPVTESAVVTDSNPEGCLVETEFAKEAGGLSGRPVQHKSTVMIAKFAAHLKGEIPIIGVGGIDSVMAAKEKIDAGASLVQVYSGFIYQGPGLIKNIVNHI